ncbi:MAG: hypothetical protein QME66_10360 [Candidatus Eisenbacteria bacterium]|nr:hypothetical protein [Candidatus Eisenbacteria bacterium]
MKRAVLVLMLAIMLMSVTAVPVVQGFGGANCEKVVAGDLSWRSLFGCAAELVFEGITHDWPGYGGP